MSTAFCLIASLRQIVVYFYRRFSYPQNTESRNFWQHWSCSGIEADRIKFYFCSAELSITWMTWFKFEHNFNPSSLSPSGAWNPIPPTMCDVIHEFFEIRSQDVIFWICYFFLALHGQSSKVAEALSPVSRYLQFSYQTLRGIMEKNLIYAIVPWLMTCKWQDPAVVA